MSFSAADVLLFLGTMLLYLAPPVLLLGGVLWFVGQLASIPLAPAAKPVAPPPPPPMPQIVRGDEMEPSSKPGPSVPLVVACIATLLLGVVSIAASPARPAAMVMAVVTAAVAIANGARRRLLREEPDDEEPDRIVLSARGRR